MAAAAAAKVLASQIGCGRGRATKVVASRFVRIAWKRECGKILRRAAKKNEKTERENGRGIRSNI